MTSSQKTKATSTDSNITGKLEDTWHRVLTHLADFANPLQFSILAAATGIPGFEAAVVGMAQGNL